LRPTLPDGASIKINGAPPSADGVWTSSLLRLGDNPFELYLTSESGIDTTYNVTVTRNGSQVHYLKASNTGVDDRFGHRIASDGDTLVVAAPWEDGSVRTATRVAHRVCKVT
jgi:hypothetical protein